MYCTVAAIVTMGADAVATTTCHYYVPYFRIITTITYENTLSKRYALSLNVKIFSCNLFYDSNK